jgi:peptidyl-prolyl cis-trans isomerase NIMA-interacting 1
LPEGWEIRMSQSKNLPYYFHPESKQSRWEPPEGADTNKLKDHMAQYHTTAGINRASGPAAPVDSNGADAGSRIHAAHLLVKHRESRRPSSWRESRITRSKEEAMEVLRGHEARIKAGEAKLGDIAVTESDCSSARKKGDLYVSSS